MAKIYFSEVKGAYGGIGPSAPEFLEVKVLNLVSYATTPGFGPGYVNTSAIIIRHFSGKVTRKLTAEENTQLNIWMQGKTKFANRAAMLLDAKEAATKAKYYRAKEEAVWAADRLGA